MNYPIWYLPDLGGGAIIGLIAVFHVFISHFAVGGGFFLVLAEARARRAADWEQLAFVKDHARFFLLVTMVLGSITGVGIWFAIALVNPSATSLLIHNFVFGWAAEWVFFTVEIFAAFVYFYLFDRLDAKTHLQVGWLYCFAAWMSLALINGIIGVMLTPGDWQTSRGFWEGFFNPSFWPSLVFRTFLAILMAGCFAFASASFSASSRVRREMSRFTAAFALTGLIGVALTSLWYFRALPPVPQQLLAGKSPTIASALNLGILGVSALFVLLLSGVLRPGWNRRSVGVVVLASGLLVMAGFEWTREAARRPYVINEVLYSNSIAKAEVGQLQDNGYLQQAVWVAHRELGEDNMLAAGEELFIHQCYACHSLDGWNNPIRPLTQNMSMRAMDNYLAKMHQVRAFMPPFAGNDAERLALAAYLTAGLHDKEIQLASTSTVAAGPPGQELAEMHCSSCHEVQELQETFFGMEVAEVRESLQTLDSISNEMSPFAGTEMEETRLAAFLSGQTPPPPFVDGGQVFSSQCLVCHGENVVLTGVRGKAEDEIFELLGRLSELQKAMPPFAGSEEERQALANYLYERTGGGQ